MVGYLSPSCGAGAALHFLGSHTELFSFFTLLFFSKDVEANTVRLKEHEQVVLVLEKSPRPSTLGSIK